MHYKRSYYLCMMPMIFHCRHFWIELTEHPHFSGRIKKTKDLLAAASGQKQIFGLLCTLRHSKQVKWRKAVIQLDAAGCNFINQSAALQHFDIKQKLSARRYVQFLIDFQHMMLRRALADR